VRRFQVHHQEIATAAPVWHELLFGCYCLLPSERRSRLEEFLLQVLAPVLSILPYDSAAAQWHATERARLSLAGLTPPFVDGQIAAIAHLHNLTLVTANTGNYLNFQDLRLENWTQ
jgi:tRNA(fMet)-specific endonuclease VapC